jgi:tetratricopeptide (TPR) repeat protein
VFFGRHSETEHCVEVLAKPRQAFVAILGAGGIGKTSLALAVMRDERMAEIFQHRRYFVSCEAAETAEALSVVFGRTIGATSQDALGEFTSLVKKEGSPVLVALDNFETPWERHESQQVAEGFLSKLAEIGQVSIILTMRGAERPLGVEWTRPFLPPLVPLSEAAAIEVFTSISDTASSDPFLIPLLRAVGMLPLAVTLVASQAQFLSCQDLLEQWNEEKTAMVSKGFDERLSSLEVSIQLSLSSPRFTRNPSAKRLLQILSVLPDGAPPEVLAAMTPSDFPLQSATSTLLRVSLAYQGQDQWLHVLCPIREYVTRHLPPLGKDLLEVFQYVNGILTVYRSQPDGSVFGKEVFREALPFFGNIRHLVDYCLSRPDDIDPGDATEAAYLAWRLQREAPRSSLCQNILQNAVKLAESRDLKVQLAHCLYALEEMHMGNDYSRVKSLLREAGQWEMLGTVTYTEANNLSGSVRTPEAIVLFEEAARIFEEHDISGRQVIGWCQAYSRALSRAGQQEKAQVLLKRALDITVQEGVPISAGLLHSVAASEAHRGMYGAAMRHIERGLLEMPIQCDARVGLNLLLLGDILYTKSALEHAEQTFTLAIQILQEIDWIEWATTAQAHMALLFTSMGRMEEANSLLDLSEEYWGKHDPDSLKNRFRYLVEKGDLKQAQSLGRRLSAAHLKAGNMGKWTTLLCHGDLAIHDGDIVQAIGCFVSHGIFAARASSRLGLSMSLMRLGDIFRTSLDDLSTAQALFETSLSLIQHMGIPRHQADCLIRLSAIKHAIGQGDSGEKDLMRARSLCEDASWSLGVAYCDRAFRHHSGAQVIDFPTAPRFSFQGPNPM